MHNQPIHSRIPRVGDEHAVAAAWDSFVRDQALPRQGLRHIVRDSWQRCRQEAVDPASRCAPGASVDHISQLQRANRDLMEAAHPVLESLGDILRECGTLIMLTDPSGTILQLSGETRARSVGEDVNLSTGGCWKEDLIGTNAIGTAIATAAPVQIYGSEHFCVDVKRWTCAAAPVLDPLSRTLLGVIDVSGVKETFHGHTLGMVIAAAKQVEGELACRDSALHQRLLNSAMGEFARYGSDCLMLLDRRGRIVRTAGSVQAARELHGVRLPFVVGGQVAGMALGANAMTRPCPTSLQPEWLHPVRDPQGELGTLVVIPLGQRRARTTFIASAPTAPAAQDAFDDIIGHSPALQAAKTRARRMASVRLPVLLLGETGAGKELFARALHQASPHAAGPFIAVNCGALTRELLASELFGYAAGAFTGARRSGFAGKFEQADGGTLFLDEIGEMPLDMQPHLLRVLQDGVVVRLGDTREHRVAVRVVAATHRDLPREVGAGRFREDLYHRLCVLSLDLPALRERSGDIDVILDHLNQRLALKYGCPPKQLQPEVHQALLRYRWPGNVRELQNVFEGMFALCEGQRIDAALLPPALVEPRGGASVTRPEGSVAGAAAVGRLDEVERQAILAAIDSCRGNMARAARTLGISRSTMYVKLALIRARDAG